MRTFKLLSLLGILLLSIPGIAQKFEAGIMLGSTSYQGDLTHGTSRINFSNAHAALGIHAGYQLNDMFTFRGKITSTAISGYDNQARASWRLERNLHFKSPLSEVGINLEFYFLEAVSNFKIQPFLQTGLNLIKFDPRAMYKGEWVALQPLGTEGQGNPAFPEKQKYSLIDYSVPLGIGLRYTINNYLSISADLTQRWTFSDYLDDVSGTYIPHDLLLSDSGEVAANLAYRGGELGYQQEPSVVRPRGNPKENDWYVISNISIIYKLNTGHLNAKEE